MPKTYSCKACEYQTTRIGNFKRHLNSKLHQRKKGLVCNDCGKSFSRQYGLKTHKCEPSLCETQEKGNLTIVQHVHQNILNICFPSMIGMEDFIKNLQTNHPLTYSQTQGLLYSFQQNIITYSSQLSHTLKENCYQQMKRMEIKEPPKMLPILYQPEIKNNNNNNINFGNQLSVYQEKIGNQWQLINNEHHSNNNLFKIIDISNKQVFLQTRQKILLQDGEKKEVAQYLIKDHQYSFGSNPTTTNTEVSLRPDHLLPIFDCGKNYYLDPSTNLVYNQTHKIGSYQHDNDCPNCSSDNPEKCWYYVVKD